MAEDKKPKIMDITAKPGASPTSRPVIIKNGPIMRDPTLVNENEDDVTQEERQIARAQSKTIKIQPLSEDELEKQTPEAKQEKAPEPEAAEVEKEEPKETEPAKEEPQESKPQETEKTEAPAEENKPSENQPEQSQPQTTPATPAQSQAAIDEQVQKEQEEELKHQEEIDKLATSKKYRLPINMKEKRRNRNVVVVGLLIVLILAVAWVDVALDAGLISNTYHLPHTHFFAVKH